MSLADLLLAVLWAGLTAYAVLGGADFGAGALHLLAPRGRAGRAYRTAITRAIGPVWEANHVWLIFFLTGLLTLFPRAFAALGAALFAPGVLALLGIVVRGAAFAFAAPLSRFDRLRRPLQLAFGVASAATPLFLGAAAAGLARGRVRVSDGAVRAGGGAGLWLGPFQAAVAMLALATCVALAASYLAVETRRSGPAGLAARFRGHALRATAATAVLAAAAVALAALEAPALFAGLTGRGLPAAVAAVGGLAVALVALRRGRDRLARAALATATAGLLWGWGLAQFPRLVGPDVTVADAAAGGPELHAIAVAFAAGAALLLPSLWLLHVAFRRHRPTEASS